MKTTMTFKSMTLIALLGAVLATPALAQPGPGMGGGPGAGWGPGMGWGNGMGRGHGMGPGMGWGGGPGARGMYNNQANQAVAPWMLMTPEERTANIIKMRAVKTFDECKAVQTEHRNVLEARAKEKGVTLPVQFQNRCDMMKARGIIS